MFASYQVNIPQSCEQCLSYIWLMDKALLCSGERSFPCPGHMGALPLPLPVSSAHPSEGFSQHIHLHTQTRRQVMSGMGALPLYHACCSHSLEHQALSSQGHVLCNQGPGFFPSHRNQGRRVANPMQFKMQSGSPESG